jgi:hypothetical protein
MNAVITDGVTLGHPCCSVIGNASIGICRQPLASPSDLYCSIHQYKKWECRVINCGSPRVAGKPVCSSHVSIWEEELAAPGRSKAMNELSKRAARAGTTLTAAISLQGSTSSQALHKNSTAATTNAPSAPAADDSKGNQESSPIVYQRRKWTHNEQLCVRPCGIIISRATMYNSEAVPAVKVSKILYTQRRA